MTLDPFWIMLAGLISCGALVGFGAFTEVNILSRDHLKRFDLYRHIAAGALIVGGVCVGVYGVLGPMEGWIPLIAGRWWGVL